MHAGGASRHLPQNQRCTPEALPVILEFVLRDVLGRPGGTVGRLGGRPGGSWGSLGAPWGSPGGPSGALLGRLEALRERFQDDAASEPSLEPIF